MCIVVFAFFAEVDKVLKNKLNTSSKNTIYAE